MRNTKKVYAAMLISGLLVPLNCFADHLSIMQCRVDTALRLAHEGRVSETPKETDKCYKQDPRGAYWKKMDLDAIDSDNSIDININVRTEDSYRNDLRRNGFRDFPLHQNVDSTLRN